MTVHHFVRMMDKRLSSISEPQLNQLQRKEVRSAHFSLKNNGEAISIVLNPNIKQEVNTFPRPSFNRL
jgi:hypothetical protein